MEDLSSPLSLALADIEILQSAYPDETSLPEQQQNTDTNNKSFPLHLLLHFGNADAFVELEFVEGYPCDSNVQISRYRSGRQHHKQLELAVAAIREAAEECLSAGIEGGLACCAAALNAWQEAEDLAATLAIQERLLEEGAKKPSTISAKKFHWISGEPLLDRKSSFQAHVCQVMSETDVHLALQQLIGSSTKIQRATHNMYAYRFVKDNPSGNNPIVQHDNDDDGEAAAGSRLAHLLEMRKEDGVLVVVSRWYGGIHLGPKRFAHITNVARQLLQSCRDNPVASERCQTPR